jgi:hypothetical protein
LLYLAQIFLVAVAPLHSPTHSSASDSTLLLPFQTRLRVVSSLQKPAPLQTCFPLLPQRLLAQTTLDHPTWALRSLRHPSLHRSLMQSLRGKRILMIGDSHTRFHYLHLAHWLCFQQQAGSKFVEKMFWPDGALPICSSSLRVFVIVCAGTLDWTTYDEKWDDFFRESTFAFDGQQMCDCHRPGLWREFGYEIRVTRCCDVEITFVLMYGMTRALGRLPLHLGDFDSLSQSRAIDNIQRCSAENRGCPKNGCSSTRQSAQSQAQVEELKAKLTALVHTGEISPDDMLNILKTYEKSNAESPPRICKGSGGYAWHGTNDGNDGVWEFATLSHFLEAWNNATGGADVFFIGQGAHLERDYNNYAHIESIVSSCSIAKKNLSSSRCIWRVPRKLKSATLESTLSLSPSVP